MQSPDCVSAGDNPESSTPAENSSANVAFFEQVRLGPCSKTETLSASTQAGSDGPTELPPQGNSTCSTNSPVQQAGVTITPTLAVMVPLYNEERTVIELLNHLLTQPCVSQVIIVDDGSTDASVPLVTEWMNSQTLDPSTTGREGNQRADERECHCVSFIQHETNKGKGRAIRTGLEHVTCSHVIIQDADLEYDPTDINKMWDTMQSGEADVVYGSRYLDKPELQKGRWILQSGVRLLNLLVRLLYGVKLTDEATCYKMFRTADLVAMNLTCERFEFCPEVTAKAAKAGLTFTETPITYNHRSNGDGKKLRLADGLSAILEVMSQRLPHSPRGVVIGILFLLGMITITVATHTHSLSDQQLTSDVTPVNGDMYDCGRVAAGTMVSHTFHIPNTTTIPLSPKDLFVIKSCGCTSAQIRNTEVVMPGQPLLLDVTIDTGQKNGQFNEAIVVSGSTQSINLDPTRVVLKGIAFPAIKATPMYVNMTIREEAPCSSIIRLSSELELNWSHLKIDCPWPELEWNQANSSHESNEIHLSYNSETARILRPRSGRIHISVPDASGEVHHVHSIPVRVEPLKKLQVVPSHLVAKSVSQDGAATFQFFLKGSDAMELAIDSVNIACGPVAFDVVDVTAISDRVFRIEAQSVGAVHGKLSGSIQVNGTDVPTTFFVSETNAPEPERNEL